MATKKKTGSPTAYQNGRAMIENSEVDFQLAALYRDGQFISYGVAVNGQLIKGQKRCQVTVDSEMHASIIKAEFHIDNQMDNPIRIDINPPIPG